MTEPAKLIDDEKAFSHEIMLYVEQLRCSLSSDDEKAIESAKQALIETGVLHADGSVKDVLCLGLNTRAKNKGGFFSRPKFIPLRQSVP